MSYQEVAFPKESVFTITGGQDSSAPIYVRHYYRKDIG